MNPEQLEVLQESLARAGGILWYVVKGAATAEELEAAYQAWNYTEKALKLVQEELSQRLVG